MLRGWLVERTGREIIVVEPSSSLRRSWRKRASALGVGVRPYETLDEAVEAIREAPVCAVVATTAAPTQGALRMARAARDLMPPAEVVFVTDDPDTLKIALRASGLVAEVLRRPATIPQLVDRLGLANTGRAIEPGRGETG